MQSLCDMRYALAVGRDSGFIRYIAILVRWRNAKLLRHAQQGRVRLDNPPKNQKRDNRMGYLSFVFLVDQLGLEPRTDRL